MSAIEIAESADALSHAVAEQFARVTTAAVRARGHCSVALAGGSTPKNVYRLLSGEPFRSRVVWDQIQFFWGDERHVPVDHQDSNYRMAAETMLSKVPVRARNIHRIHGEIRDADLAAREYEDVLRASFKERDSAPRFDLILLGLGRDGHTASLFPGTPALAERQRWCVANWVDTLSAYRLTLTLPVLNAARVVLFTVSGSEKAPIVREVLRGTRDVPARLVQPFDGDLRWMLDRAAAGELGEATS
jgi:6-phosphogluconolactonase